MHKHRKHAESYTVPLVPYRICDTLWPTLYPRCHCDVPFGTVPCTRLSIPDKRGAGIIVPPRTSGSTTAASRLQILRGHNWHGSYSIDAPILACPFQTSAGLHSAAPNRCVDDGRFKIVQTSMPDFELLRILIHVMHRHHSRNSRTLPAFLKNLIGPAASRHIHDISPVHLNAV